MPLDAICLGAVTNELNTVLTGCRIERKYISPIAMKSLFRHADKAVRAVFSLYCSRYAACALYRDRT